MSFFAARRSAAGAGDGTANPEGTRKTRAMRVSVLKNHFEGLPGAMADIARDGFWPTTFISKPSPPPAVHWHDCDVHGYVM